MVDAEKVYNSFINIVDMIKHTSDYKLANISKSSDFCSFLKYWLSDDDFNTILSKHNLYFRDVITSDYIALDDDYTDYEVLATNADSLKGHGIYYVDKNKQIAYNPNKLMLFTILMYTFDNDFIKATPLRDKSYLTIQQRINMLHSMNFPFINSSFKDSVTNAKLLFNIRIAKSKIKYNQSQNTTLARSIKQTKSQSIELQHMNNDSENVQRNHNQLHKSEYRHMLKRGHHLIKMAHSNDDKLITSELFNQVAQNHDHNYYKHYLIKK